MLIKGAIAQAGVANNAKDGAVAVDNLGESVQKVRFQDLVNLTDKVRVVGVLGRYNTITEN